MRNQFTFYKSFDDVIEDMNDKQIAEYVKAMLDVQFLRIKIEDIEFKDSLLSIVWKSQKHSIKTSIKGYLDSQKRDNVKNPYLGVYADSCNPCQGVRQQEQVKEQVKGKEEEEEQALVVSKLTDATYVAEYLYNRLLTIQPNLKSNYKSWIKDIDLAIRIDGRTKEHLIRCINWMYTDKKNGSFWIANVKSGKKLREKYDTMEIQAKQNKSTVPIVDGNIFDKIEGM